jgi:L-alanine-DL-glutamate epimerase-like enolase superfamily enzyme
VPRIERVTIHERTLPLKRPFVTAVRTAYAVNALIVEVRDSDGRSGWGEAPTSWRVTGESVESVTAAVLGPLKETVVGLSSADPEESSEAMGRAVVRNPSARMALDCALYDLAARAAGVPLFRFLGASAAEIRTDMTLSAVITDPEIDSLCRTAVEFANSGFGTLKVKTGAGGNDVKALIEVRRAVGADVRLRVDANQAWSRDDAVVIIRSFEDAGVGVEFVEQPVGRDDIDGLTYVTSRVETPIMADESVWTRRELREIIRSRAADMINIKLAKSGGLREALDLVNMSRENDVGIIAGCMAESHVGIAAAAALASAIDSSARANVRPHDLDGGLLLTHSPVEGGVTYDGDRVQLSEMPGTGIIGLAPEEFSASIT